MQALLLVGGKGTRLRPLTINTPKPLAPLLNKPFLLYQTELLKKYGIVDIVLSLSYLAEVIEDFFGDGSQFGVRIKYSVEEEPLGTAGALKHAEELLGDESIVVLNGDIFTDIDLSGLFRFHIKNKAKVSITLVPVEDPTLYGLVELTGNKRVLRFVEKPRWEEVTTNLINAGIYVFEREVLTYIPPGRSFSFERELFPILLQRDEPVYGYEAEGYWLDIGSHDKYQQAHRDILEGKIKVEIDSVHRRRGKVWIGADPTISPNAKLIGPVIIGDHCQIGDGVEIASYSVIGDNCRIKNGARLDGSIIWEGTIIGEEAKLKDCIIGKNCVIDGNVIVSPGTVLGDGSRVKCYSRLG